jgi:transcriptional regulator with XRE-family HTH domain
MSIQLEISLSAYSKIERDETEISLKRLQQIAEILHISVNGILQFDEQVLFENAKSTINSKKVSSQDDPLVEQLRSEIQFLRQLLNNQIISNNG